MDHMPCSLTDMVQSSKKSYRSIVLHRLLLKSRETSNCSFLKIADLTIDEAYAHKYLETVSDVHHFKTSSWKDVKLSIYI